MRACFTARTAGQIEFGVIYGGLTLVLLAVFRFFPSVTVVFPACVFRKMSGIPCPTCGATRAVLSMSRGDIVDSVALNPLIAAVLAAAMLYFIYSTLSLLFRTRRIRLSISERDKDIIRFAAVCIVIINWFYLILAR